jgi:hypothetical protein
MAKYLRAVRKLALWQQIALGAMLLLVVLTWIAVCLILTGAISP